VTEQRDAKHLEGLGIAGMFWLWGSLAWVAPPYIGFGGWGQWAFNIAGAVLIAIAFAGAGIELGKLWKNEAFEYWGVGLLFLVPAVLLHLTVWWAELAPFWEVSAKSIALILAAFGGAFVMIGLPYLFARSTVEGDGAPEPTPEEKTLDRQRRKELLASAGLLVLTAASAILKVLFGVG
jgi:hypothetical protein